MTTPSPAPQRLGATYPPYPFWAWTCSRNPEVAEDKGQWHRLTGPLPRGRSWPFYYWLPDQPEKPTCDPRTTPSPAPQWAKPYTEIQELAQAIRRNLQDDACPYVQDDKWVITAAAHALVILDNVELATKHAAAISEENERLKREVERLNDERTCFYMDVEAAIGRGRLLGAPKSAVVAIEELRLWSEQAREELRKIRNSAGEQVMVCTAEGHSECVHRANAVLAAHPAQGMEGRG